MKYFQQKIYFRKLCLGKQNCIKGIDNNCRIAYRIVDMFTVQLGVKIQNVVVKSTLSIQIPD